MNRREALAVLGAAAFAGPLQALAQRRFRVPRIGMLWPDVADDEWVRLRRRWIQNSLGDAGYEVGKNVLVEWRYAEGNPERLIPLANDLIRLKVDAIVALGVTATHAAKQVTQTVPIVMYSYYDDPVKRGLVASLARPGGNVTGTLWNAVDSTTEVVKQFEILKLAVPALNRVASMWWPWAPDAERIADDMNRRAQKAYGFVVTNFVVRSTDEIPAALDRIAAFKPDALFVATFPVIRARLREIAAFATSQKLVSFGTGGLWTEVGGLLHYGPDVRYLYARMVGYVDRILRGAKPAELPVERPARYELVFNALTAQKIGYEPPAALQLRIDRVIE